MKPWPKHPVIYEINTWVWLNELSQKYQRAVNLGPFRQKNGIRLHLLVLTRVVHGRVGASPAGIAISMQNPGLLEDFKRALPDFVAEDNVGSPYCVRRYVVDELLGGPQGLTIARRNLSERGLRLILDFVPNHVAPDHPWVNDHPEYFVRGNADDAQNDPACLVEIAGNAVRAGPRSVLSGVADVLQLNAFQPGLRQAVIETITDIAGQCDGIRCDMAMLMLNDIFERTWGDRAGDKPIENYWKT